MLIEINDSFCDCKNSLKITTIGFETTFNAYFPLKSVIDHFYTQLSHKFHLNEDYFVYFIDVIMVKHEFPVSRSTFWWGSWLSFINVGYTEWHLWWWANLVTLDIIYNILIRIGQSRSYFDIHFWKYIQVLL